MNFFPVAQASHSGTKIEWLKEKTTTEDAVTETTVGSPLVWSEDITYDVAELTLKQTYIQRKLDNFLPSVYQTFNNYEQIVLKEMKKGFMRRLGDRFFYGDKTDGSALQFDGLHAMAGEAYASGLTSLVIDEGNGALSLANIRTVLDQMKFGCDLIFVPPCLGIRLDQMVEEAGIASYVGFTRIVKDKDSLGQAVLRYAGIPIIRTDYLVGEGADTGVGASLRTKTGSTYYSMLFVKFGNSSIGEADPGVKFVFGNTEGAGDFYRLDYFDKLENYDAKGMRMVNYGALMQGSYLSVGRIHDITDAAITA